MAEQCHFKFNLSHRFELTIRLKRRKTLAGFTYECIFIGSIHFQSILSERFGVKFSFNRLIIPDLFRSKLIMSTDFDLQNRIVLTHFGSFNSAT